MRDVFFCAVDLQEKQLMKKTDFDLALMLKDADIFKVILHQKSVYEYETHPPLCFMLKK